LGGNEYSVKQDFFEIGNYTMNGKYDNQLPWLTNEKL